MQSCPWVSCFIALATAWLTFTALLTPVSSQAYHFSNGWMPGKRSALPLANLHQVSRQLSDMTSSDPSDVTSCHIQPQVFELVMTIIQVCVNFNLSKFDFLSLISFPILTVYCIV